MNKLLLAGLHTGLTLTSIGAVLAFAPIANALPGQSVDEAEAWMQAHPTLRAHPRERLSLRRNDTPARRYTFQGSIFRPGAIGAGAGLLQRRRAGEPIVVRSEKFTLVDTINGVSVERLEDALRMLYGAEVYADYRRSPAALTYSSGRMEDRGTPSAPRAQLLEGRLYAYLIEIIPNADGTIHTGAFSVMLKEDMPAVRDAVRSQEIEREEFERLIEGQKKSYKRVVKAFMTSHKPAFWAGKTAHGV